MHKDTTRRSGEISLLASIAILLTALAMGCAMEDPISDSEPEIEASEATILAEIITGDGVEYTFLATGSGDVGVAAMAPGPVDSALVPGPDSTLVELYQSISGQPAPEALVIAERRAAELARSSDDPAAVEAPLFSPGDPLDARSDELPEGVTAQTQALTSSQFQQMYCPSGWNFLYCWPDRAGNPWVQRTSTYLAGAMYAKTCNTRFRYQYYDGGWKTFQDRYAAPGQHWWYWMSGSQRSRRWEILGNPSSCGVHFSVWGNY